MENKEKVKNYKDLEIWKKGMDLVDRVYEITLTFPDFEKYGLASQMQKAAVSIPSNIAEGFMRFYSKEYIRFLLMTLGSCAELETQLIISHRRDYLNDEKLEMLKEDIDHELRMIRSLIKKLRN